jgi:hypothetical protein
MKSTHTVSVRLRASNRLVIKLALEGKGAADCVAMAILRDNPNRFVCQIKPNP